MYQWNDNSEVFIFRCVYSRKKLRHARPFVCPQVSSRLPLDEFSLNFILPTLIKISRKNSVWLKLDNNVKYLSTFYIVDSNICSSKIQKRVIVVRACPYLIFLPRFAAKVIERSGSTDTWLKESKEIRSHDSVMLHVCGLSSLHLNLLLEINTYRIFYPKNTGSVFNNSDEMLYSVACKDERRSTRDRYRD